MFKHFQTLFNGEIDPHCATPCQFSYTPSCPQDAVNAFQSFYETGALFDAATVRTDSNPNDGTRSEAASMLDI